MVGVNMGDEDRTNCESGSVPHHLTLSPLSAVEEEKVPLSLNREPAHVPPNGRSGCCGTEEREADHLRENQG